MPFLGERIVKIGWGGGGWVRCQIGHPLYCCLLDEVTDRLLGRGELMMGRKYPKTSDMEKKILQSKSCRGWRLGAFRYQ